MKNETVFFKVLTIGLKSLPLVSSLRSGAIPHRYKVGRWTTLREPQRANGEKRGGLWVARTISKARWIKGYMAGHYGRRRSPYRMKTRVFQCYIGATLNATSCQIKTEYKCGEINLAACCLPYGVSGILEPFSKIGEPPSPRII